VRMRWNGRTSSNLLSLASRQMVQKLMSENMNPKMRPKWTEGYSLVLRWAMVLSCHSLPWWACICRVDFGAILGFGCVWRLRRACSVEIIRYSYHLFKSRYAIINIIIEKNPVLHQYHNSLHRITFTTNYGN
jgi:hypothetical protein